LGHKPENRAARARFWVHRCKRRWKAVQGGAGVLGMRWWWCPWYPIECAGGGGFWGPNSLNHAPKAWFGVHGELVWASGLLWGYKDPSSNKLWGRGMGVRYLVVGGGLYSPGDLSHPSSPSPPNSYPPISLSSYAPPRSLFVGQVVHSGVRVRW